VYNDRAGPAPGVGPWVDPQAASPILNYVYGQRLPVNSPAEVNWELSFEAVSVSAATTAAPTPKPTLVPVDSSIPVSFMPGPCTTVNCGEGLCMVDPALGRPAGWCQCPNYLVGGKCQSGGTMLKAPPGFLGIEVSLVETRLERFNDDGDQVDFKFKLRVTFSDPRIALLDGEYRLSQVDMLVDERKLWLPEPILAGFKEPVFTKTVKVTGTQVVYEVEIRGFKNAVANYNFYPFDPQDAKLLVSFSPGIKWLSPLPTTETSTCNDPGDGWILGHGLQAQLGTTAGWNVVVEELSGQQTIVADILVSRNYIYFVIRVFVPSIILVVVSWSGFFIKPQLLMPRFASGFISFLALQSFIGTARKDMPANLKSLCWLDTYMTFIGILMGFACVENVSAQFIFENFSESITMRLDNASRKAFPATFVIGTIGLWLAPSVPVALAVAITMLVILGGSLSVWTGWQIHEFPYYATEKAIEHHARYTSMVSPSRRQVPFAFPTSREMNHLFHAIDIMNPPERELITVDCWIEFICKCDKDFNAKPAFQQLIKAELVKRFGDEIDPGEFPPAFEVCIKLIAEFKRTGSVAGVTTPRKVPEAEEEFDEDADVGEETSPETKKAAGKTNGTKESPREQTSGPAAGPQVRERKSSTGISMFV
jgi:hypothetical protein